MKGQPQTKVIACFATSKQGTSGHVRRCHDDQHLGHVVLMDGVPTPFDALTFDETLQQIQSILPEPAEPDMSLRPKGGRQHAQRHI